MQEETEQSPLVISTCPICGTRLMCGRLIKGGFQKCSRCKNCWIVEMTVDRVVIEKAPPHLMWGKASPEHRYN